jgi:hypothetical protein
MTLRGEGVLYVGRRTPLLGCSVYVLRGGMAVALPHVGLHSPSGFEWGYVGSGPADLALSLLADHLGCAPGLRRLLAARDLVAERRAAGACPEAALAWRLHQELKFDLVAHFPRDEWTLRGTQLAAWLALHTPAAEAAP